MAEPGVLSQRVGGVEGNRTGRFTRDGIRHDPRLYESEDSIAIRIYLSALTLTFLVVAVMTRGLGVLEATVVVCPLLYMILDIREELQALRSLEARVFSLSR
ncbi:MAG TPA: hypothetical protein DHU55_08330 [Blastocatellia bacterium]|jgi:hypothetical protein|nr:hypothetical protein [Blastocatellia bacterium]HCX29760.1 hypothetical protein [Blastocatellia bacterium]